MRPEKPKPTKSELLAELESIRYSLSEEEIEQLKQQEDCEIPVLVEPVPLPDETDISLTGTDSLAEDDLVFDDSGPRTRSDTKITYSPANAFSADSSVQGTVRGEIDEDDREVLENSVLFSGTDMDAPSETTITMSEKPELFEPSPGQQSLFDQPASMPPKKNARQENSKQKALPSAIEEENPFLPKHIRDRLSRGRSTIMEELMQVGDSLNRDKSQFQYSPANADAEASAGSDTSTPPAPVLYSSNQADRVVEELVAEYLPRMEAELRKRLREQLSTTGNQNTADSETSS